MNKKGFTIIELLAVITILGFIAIILTPIIINVISHASLSTFKQSTISLKKATKDYVRDYELVNKEEVVFPLTFICDGISCKDINNNTLSLSGKIPLSGKIIIDNMESIYIDKITDGTYYVSGLNDDLIFTKDVTELDSIVYNRINNYALITDEDNSLDYTSSIIDLGVPLLTKYPGSTNNEILSRIVWDMKLFNNHIYIASGDYDKNTGPVDLYYYDINNNTFVKDYTFDEEQINRFVVIDNKLVIPGIDNHSGGWDGGHYYVLEGNNWVARNIQDAIHNFDVVKFKGNIFVGIGNDSDSSILKSDNNGLSFTYVDIYDKNNNKIVTDSANSSTTRVYDLYVFKNKLYALSNMSIFEYNETNNIFKQIDTIYSYAYGMTPGLIYSFPLKEKIEYKDKMVYVHGSLSYTTDITLLPTHIIFDKTSYAHDILVYKDELYVLCNMVYNEKTYISVFKSNDATRWNPVMYIEYTDFATSFEFDGKSFYFGIGAVQGNVLDTATDNLINYSLTGPNSGRILKVNIN